MYFSGMDNNGSLAADAPKCVMGICVGGYEVISTRGDMLECNIPAENQGKPVIAIGARAFKGKTDVRRITVPSSVAKIGSEAFYGCTALESITINGAISEIGAQTFYGCSSLAEVKIASGVRTISRCAFGSCKALKSFVLPATVATIGDEAFRDCSGLEIVVIPASVTSIGRYAFWGANSAVVYYMGTAAQWASVRVMPGDEKLSAANVLYYSEAEPAQDAGQCWHYVDGVPTPWVVQATVAADTPQVYGSILTAMGIGGQNAAPNVTVTSASTVTGAKATPAPRLGVSKYDDYCDQNFNMALSEGGFIIEKFKGFSGTTVCVIPEDYRGRPIVGIGKSAFEGCKAMTNVVIAQNIVVIGPSAFRDCTAISSIAIPESVKMICEFAFAGCSSLVNVAFVGNELLEVGRCAFSECRALSSFKLPSSVTTIGSGAFFSCEALKSFEVPDGVEKIDEDTFKYCSALASVKLSRVTEIGYEAFMGTAISHIEIPEGTKVVASSAFASCASLKSVVIPTTLAEVGKAAFSGSEALECIYYKGKSEDDLDGHIRFARGNDNIFEAVLYCYSELRREEGAYWRYVDDVPKPWIEIKREKPKSSEVAEIVDMLDKKDDEDGSNRSFGSKGGFDKSKDSERGSRFGGKKSGDSERDSRFGGKKSGDSERGSRFGGSEGGKKRFGQDEDSRFGGGKKFGTEGGPGQGGSTEGGPGQGGSTEGGKSTPAEDPYARFADNFSYALRGTSYEVVRYQGSSSQCSIPEENGGKAVTSIGQSAFFGAPVTKVNANNNITAIGDYAFSRCDKLAAVNGVDGVLKVGEGAFEGCGSLDTISITSADEIGSGAFKRCSRLSSVVISRQLGKIGTDAFSMCDSLRRIFFIGNAQDFDQIEVEDGNHAFLSAEMYIYSFERPTTSVKSWHLVDNVPTPW